MTTPRRRPPAATPHHAGALPAIAALLLAAGFAAAPAARAQGSAPPRPEAAAPAPMRAYLQIGPYRPPVDTDHWVDPRGSVAIALGAGVPVCPAALLGIEGLAWFGSYAADATSGFTPQTRSRMHGQYVGLGPTCLVRTTYRRFDPWASATLLLVRSHLAWPGTFVVQPGSEELQNAWKGTLAFGAGVDARLWGSGGLSLRYQYVPLTSDFGAPSRGSADTGVNAVLLGLYSDVPVPFGYRGPR